MCQFKPELSQTRSAEKGQSTRAAGGRTSSCWSSDGTWWVSPPALKTPRLRISPGNLHWQCPTRVVRGEPEQAKLQSLSKMRLLGLLLNTERVSAARTTSTCEMWSRPLFFSSTVSVLHYASKCKQIIQNVIIILNSICQTESSLFTVLVPCLYLAGLVTEFDSVVCLDQILSTC